MAAAGPCRIARWSMMKRVSGCRSINAVPASTLPQHSRLTGKSSFTAACRIRSRPGSLGSRFASFVIMTRMLARCLLPVGDDIAHGWIIWVDRLDDREPTGMGPLHFHRITRVVAVQGKGGDKDRAVDADLVHRRHHLVTRNVIGPVRHTVPGSIRSVRLISVDLGVDDRHRGS